MKFLLAKKVAMSLRYEGDRAIPVTVLEALPCTVTQVKTEERDGYGAVQVGAGIRRVVTKALRGHIGDLGSFRFLREFRSLSTTPKEKPRDWKVGDEIDASIFSPGDRVQATGTVKGRGFQGVVKRHRFHGQDAGHGNKDQERMPGSIGSTGPARVFKGTRMGGRMGGNKVTQRNLKIVATDVATSRIEVRGAVPGAKGSLVALQSYEGYWNDGARRGAA
jgi:large subunit ribosomal protein L3